MAYVEPGRTGKRALSLAAAKDGAWHSPPMPVWEGRRYTLRGWVKPTDATGENRLLLMWYSGNLWTWLSQDASDTVTGTGDWREVRVTGVAPKDAVFARVTLVSKDNTGQVLFDDVSLNEE